MATLEAEYGWVRPISFANSVATDPLSHPLEPTGGEGNEKKDLYFSLTKK